MLAKNGFELTKWNINSWQVMTEFGGTDVDSTVSMDEQQENSVLGIKWVPITDEFHYIVTVPHSDEKVTKRCIVACVARIIDPMGLVYPLSVSAKLIIRELWEEKYDWDVEISGELCTKWKQFVGTLPQISALKIPQCVKTTNENNAELHGFSDASLKAYECCVYAKTTNSDGTKVIGLVSAKLKVSQ